MIPEAFVPDAARAAIDPQTTPDATARTVRSKRRPAHTGHIDRTPYISVDGGPRLMTSVLFVPSAHGTALHPTEKPVGILDPLIRYGCPPGGTVLDPFAGSGIHDRYCRGRHDHMEAAK